MKQLSFILLAFLMFIRGAGAQTTAPQCTVLSIDRIGGIGVDAIGNNPGDIIYPDGTFSLTLSSDPDPNIKACPPLGYYFQRYTDDYTAILDTICAPMGVNFQYPTFFVFPLANGDTILFGQSNDGGYNYGMERRDASGNVLWTKSYGGSASDAFVSAVPAPDGSGFFINGGSLSDDGDVGLHYGGGFSYDIWVVKVNNDGDLLWSKVIGGNDNDNIVDMVPADDGGLYLFGVSTSSDYDVTGNHGGEDVYIVKLDSVGHIEWHRCYGGSGTDGGQHFKALEDGSGGFYVGAATESSDGDVQHRPAMGVDFWLLHIDSAGNLLWENTYGGPGLEFMYDMCRSTDGSIWMGGIIGGGIVPGPTGGDVAYSYGWHDGWVVHVDTLGNFMNSCTLGANNSEEVVMLHPLPDGTILAGGRYDIFYGPDTVFSPKFPHTIKGGADIFIARLSPDNDLGIDKEQANISLWTLFPNPAQQAFSIEIKNNNRKFHITVTDAQGRRVYHDKFKSKITIPTLSWPPGMYWVTISRGILSDTKKLIIKR